MTDTADPPPSGERPASLAALTLGAIGVVFGDIGTSPIYAFREAFGGHHPLVIGHGTVYGVLSLIFWSMMLVVTLKYITLLTRAHNKGEGGSLALLALISRRGGGRWSAGIVLLGVFACALFYGDSMITPAISVLSAVEGLGIVRSDFQPLVVPIAMVLLVALFVLRAGGTARLQAFFGPILLLYFLTLAAFGLMSVLRDPAIVGALDPRWALRFIEADPWRAFLALGSVVLAVTGAEALYAEMGQFGRRPIRLGWLFLVLPALMLNYLGQGALILADPKSVASPFYLLAPEPARIPLLLLATLTALIASHAVLSGTFSVTQQAIQLGFVPRLRILRSSVAGQAEIYMPVVHWALLVMVLILLLTFGSSSDLAAAYGVAVTGAMLIDTILLAILLLSLWQWKRWLTLPLLALILLVDLAFFGAVLTKVPDGGWFSVLVGLVLFTLLTTWAKGRHLMRERMRDVAMPVEIFIKSAANSATRVPGTAVFMTTAMEGVPPSLLHNLKHNRCLHERVMLLTVVIEDVPQVEEHRRCELDDLGSGFFRLVLHFGFMEDSDIPATLATIRCGADIKMMETSFFLARQTLLASAKPGMALWREQLFAWMLRNAESAMEFFKLPPNRVVELGSQVEI